MSSFSPQYEQSAPNDLITLPLWRDVDLGDYQTQVYLNNSPFTAITDTGSNLFIMNSSDCNKCFGSDTNGEYMQTVNYGGGQENHYYTRQATWNNANNLSVDVAVSVDATMPGSTPQNILGLSPYNNTLFPALKTQFPPEVFFNFPAGKLYIGNTSRVVSKQGLVYPIVPYRGTSTFSYVSVPISSSDVLTINGVTIPGSVSPGYLLIDSGTTNTICNQDFYDFVKRNSSNMNEGTFIFTQDSKTLTFRFPLSTLIVEYLPPGKLLLLGNRWLSEFNLRLSYENYINKTGNDFIEFL
jgi:hypothetical protein